ncbi:hypothetical protein P692DRAFT_201875121 [Suillus brevipes Sb2]|nr:hypothetical protein P692DRAFT_201875121 [Suillus brevipes Sb2]
MDIAVPCPGRDVLDFIAVGFFRMPENAGRSVYIQRRQLFPTVPYPAIYPIVNLSRRPYCPPLPPSSAIHLPFPPSSTFPAIFPAVFSPANYSRCIRYILSHHCASLNTSAIAWIPRTSTSGIPWTNQTSHTPKFSMISRDASGRRLSRKVGRLIRNLSPAFA